MEKNYSQLTPLAKKGINRFVRMSSKCMMRYGEKFIKETGKNPNNVHLKDEFFEFVAKNRMRCRK